MRNGRTCKRTATGRCVRAGLCATLAIGVLASSTSAQAQALRLRGDALVDTQSGGASPVGLFVLQGQDKARPWMDVEGLVWGGAGGVWGSSTSVTGDVLVLAVHLREPHGYAEVRAGRFVLATGAVFPVQLDGGEVLLRSPWGEKLEVFGGAPVVPRFGARAYDWLAGARASQTVASKVTLGVSYVQRRDDGEISNEEVGADLAAALGRWLDVSGKAAYDLTSPGIADARLSAATRLGPVRLELFGLDQSPGRLLPATSLFSVLGDFASQQVGGTARWFAAPRLDVTAGGAGQLVGGELGANGWIRSTLRLDDRGDGDLGMEVRRVDVTGARWTGVRGIAAQPLGHGFRFSTEVEVVVPDQPDGKGSVWPWGLMALAWRRRQWEIAAATEAASTPEHRYEVNALARVACALGVP